MDAASSRPDQSPPRGSMETTRAFFAPRAAGWEERFPDDGPGFAAAVDALNPPRRGTLLDAACGTGRALPFLRRAVGSAGTVIGLDITPEMLAEASRRDRRSAGELVLGDVNRLPLRPGSLDAVFGAGLLPHLADPLGGLTELARVTRPGGRIALFHPIGRVALAARHGRTPDVNDPRAEPAIRALLAASGWDPDLVDDSDVRYLVIATRTTRT